MTNAARLDVLLLGPVGASIDGLPVSLGAPKQRAVLAMLALKMGRTVTTDRLAEGLWGDIRPPSAAKMIQHYVSQLRSLIAASDAEILTRGPSYELRLHAGHVDALRFASLLEQGRPREALELWRDEPLTDIADEPFASAEIRRLEVLHLQGMESAIDLDLAAGQHVDVLSELPALLEAHPLRERLHAQYMLALYRSGRQADALEAYRCARAALVDQIGVEPGPELRRLQEAILRQDAMLDASTLQRVELPPELDTSSPMIGRDQELDWLQRGWRRARGGAGSLVLVAGPAGIGKTRLAAELAGAVLAEHAAVIYASGVPDAAVAAAESARRPTLIVLDDVDRATTLERARLNGLLDRVGSLPVLAVATATGGAQAPACDTVTLAPLDATAVRTLAQLYAGPDAEVPVARLLARSGGLPHQVHDIVAGWAHELATGEVRDAASRIAADRPALRAAEDTLVTSVVKLHVGRERAAQDREVLVACPFKGLAPFDVEDAKFFCGRERLVAEMVARLTGAPLLGIVGASGSGKSSALRAGLLAALAAGVLPESDRWTQSLMRPGEHPLRTLGQSTTGLESRGRSVVAVDQFEELFTTCDDEQERAAFIEALVTLTRDPRRRVLVLITIRADFYGRCADYPAFARLLGVNHVLVGPMQRDELRRAIEVPAQRAGLRIGPGLVDALTAGVEGEPGALPLLSTSLLELWQHRDGQTLRLGAYELAGGVHGAVARLAERAYGRLDATQQQVARRILLRLAGEGQGDTVVRRRVESAELEGDGVAAVLAVLADERLVTIGDGEVEVAHEALLREWPRLRGWLEEDAEGRRLHRHMTDAARDWLAAERDPGELYRGARLAAALDWSAGNALNERERAFLAASRDASEAESARQRRANRRLRATLGAVAALLALAVVAGVAALSQRSHAERATITANAQRMGAEALARDSLDQALLLARAGVHLEDSAATRSQLLSVLLRNPQALGTFAGDWEPMHYLSLSPDGRRVAIGTAFGVVTIFDTARRQPVGRPYRLEAGYVVDLNFAPDGRTFAVTGFEEGSPRGTVDVVDVRSGVRRVHIELPRFPEPAAWLGVHVLFAPNGRDLVVQQVHDPIDLTGPASVLRRFDGATGAPLGAPLRVGRHQTVLMWGSGDRTRLFVTSKSDNETYMLDARRLRVLRTWPVGDFAGVVNPDASVFALGSQDGTVRALDLRSGEVRTFPEGHDASVLRMRFTSDGRTLVTSGADGVIIAWDVARGERRMTLSGHARGNVWGLDLSADGRTAYSSGADKRAFVWDLTGERSLVRPFTVDRPYVPDDDDMMPRGLALSPDGRTLAIGHSDGMVDLVDSRTLQTRRSVRALPGFVAALAFSPDGRRLAVTGQRGRLTLWDARTLRPAGELSGQHTTSQALVFSPDGTLLAASELGRPMANGAGYVGGSVRVWDVRRRALTGFHVPVGAVMLAFSRAGGLLAIAADEATTKVHDVHDGRLVARLRGSGGMRARSVAFSHDGRLLAVGGFEGGAQLWSTQTWKPVGRRIDAHDGARTLWLGFNRDDTLLATAGLDGVAQVVDVATQTEIGVPLRVEPDSFLAAALSPDGRQLFVVSPSRAAVRWNLSPDAWKQHACRVAGRELTRREWQDVAPGTPYRFACRAR